MLSAKFGHRLDVPLSVLIRNSFFAKLHPNILTLLGFSFNLLAAVLILYDHWKTAAAVILIAGLFDMLDGAAARTMKRETKFGGFIDSVTDRYSDMVLVLSFIIYFSLQKNIHMVFLCSIASIGFVLIPYTKARAEKFISSPCSVGIMERAERIILITVGCFFNIIEPIFWILAVLTHLTVLQRIHYTWKECQKMPDVENKTIPS